MIGNAVNWVTVDRREAAEHLAFVLAVVEELDWLSRFKSCSSERTRMGAFVFSTTAGQVRRRAQARFVELHGWDATPWYRREEPT